MTPVAPSLPAGAVAMEPKDIGSIARIAERVGHGSPFEGQPVRCLRIVQAPDRGQLRLVLTGTKTTRSVAYPSLKFRCARYGEGETEDARILDEEVRTDVARSIAQPFRIDALIGDRWHASIPDFVTLYADGRRAIVECKRDHSRFLTRDGARQSFLAETAAAWLGVGYEKYVLANAGDDVRRANVERVQAARFTPVEDVDAILAAGLLAYGPARLDAVAAKLDADPVQGAAKAFALMVRRVVKIDLATELGPHSECRRVAPLPTDLPSITNLGDFM